MYYLFIPRDGGEITHTYDYYLFIPRDGGEITHTYDDEDYFNDELLKKINIEARIIHVQLCAWTDPCMDFSEFDGKDWIDLEGI
jgi:hypothetical protein